MFHLLYLFMSSFSSIHSPLSPFFLFRFHSLCNFPIVRFWSENFVLISYRIDAGKRKTNLILLRVAWFNSTPIVTTVIIFNRIHSDNSRRNNLSLSRFDVKKGGKYQIIKIVVDARRRFYLGVDNDFLDRNKRVRRRCESESTVSAFEISLSIGFLFGINEKIPRRIHPPTFVAPKVRVPSWVIMKKNRSPINKRRCYLVS